MYMADVMYIFASQTTLEVLMGPQSLVGQLLGGGISSKLQRGGYLNAGEGPLPLKEKYDRPTRVHNQLISDFSLHLPSCWSYYLSQALVSLVPLWGGNKGSYFSPLVYSWLSQQCCLR